MKCKSQSRETRWLHATSSLHETSSLKHFFFEKLLPWPGFSPCGTYSCTVCCCLADMGRLMDLCFSVLGWHQSMRLRTKLQQSSFGFSPQIGSQAERSQNRPRVYWVCQPFWSFLYVGEVLQCGCWGYHLSLLCDVYESMSLWSLLLSQHPLVSSYLHESLTLPSFPSAFKPKAWHCRGPCGRGRLDTWANEFVLSKLMK